MNRTITLTAILIAALLPTQVSLAAERGQENEAVPLADRIWNAEVQRDAAILLRSQAEAKLEDAEQDLALARVVVDAASVDLRLARWRMDRAWISGARTRLDEARGSHTAAQDGVSRAHAEWTARDRELSRAEDRLELLARERGAAVESG
jgi:hypothetical protein